MIQIVVTVTAFLLQQQEGQRAAERIQQAQYCALVQHRAEHREVERAQPESHLTPAEEAAQSKALRDRLLGIHPRRGGR